MNYEPAKINLQFAIPVCVAHPGKANLQLPHGSKLIAHSLKYYTFVILI